MRRRVEGSAGAATAYIGSIAAQAESWSMRDAENRSPFRRFMPLRGLSEMAAKCNSLIFFIVFEL
jgi:hypothetical protein